MMRFCISKRGRDVTRFCDYMIHKLTKQYFIYVCMSDGSKDVAVALDSKPVHYLGLPLSGAAGSF